MSSSRFWRRPTEFHGPFRRVSCCFGFQHFPEPVSYLGLILAALVDTARDWGTLRAVVMRWSLFFMHSPSILFYENSISISLSVSIASSFTVLVSRNPMVRTIVLCLHRVSCLATIHHGRSQLNT